LRTLELGSCKFYSSFAAVSTFPRNWSIGYFLDSPIATSVRHNQNPENLSPRDITRILVGTKSCVTRLTSHISISIPLSLSLYIYISISISLLAHYIMRTIPALCVVSLIALSVVVLVVIDDVSAAYQKDGDVVVLTADSFEHDTQVSTGATTGDWFVKV
jgi:hypothetical protein